MSRAGAVNRVELESQVLCAAIRQSFNGQDRLGSFTSVRELSHLFPDLLPKAEDPDKVGNKANYYEVLDIKPQSSLNHVLAAYLRRVRKFLQAHKPKENRDEFSRILSAGFVLRKPRLRLSHDMVVARRWLMQTNAEDEVAQPAPAAAPPVVSAHQSSKPVAAVEMPVLKPPPAAVNGGATPPTPVVQEPSAPPPTLAELASMINADSGARGQAETDAEAATVQSRAETGELDLEEMARRWAEKAAQAAASPPDEQTPEAKQDEATKAAAEAAKRAALESMAIEAAARQTAERKVKAEQQAAEKAAAEKAAAEKAAAEKALAEKAAAEQAAAEQAAQSQEKEAVVTEAAPAAEKAAEKQRRRTTEFVFDESALAPPKPRADVPKIVKLMEAARLISDVEVTALCAQVERAPNIPVERFILNAGYLTSNELNSLRLADVLLNQGKITMAQFQVAMYDERSTGLRMAESLQVRGWLSVEVQNSIEEWKKRRS